MYPLKKIVLMTFGIILHLSNASDQIYRTYEYAFARIFNHDNNSIRTSEPEGPSGYIQCANACSSTKVSAGRCTAFNVENGSRCVFYHGLLYDSPGKPTDSGTDVNRLVGVKWCENFSRSPCRLISRQKVQRSEATAICEAMGARMGEIEYNTKSHLAVNVGMASAYFGGHFDIWVAARKRWDSARGFYWEHSNRDVESSLWASGEPLTLTDNQDSCVYNSVDETGLRVAPCTNQYAFMCTNFQKDDF